MRSLARLLDDDGDWSDQFIGFVVMSAIWLLNSVVIGAAKVLARS